MVFVAGNSLAERQKERPRISPGPLRGVAQRVVGSAGVVW